MILHLLELVYSPACFIGIVGGTGFWLLYCRAKSRLLDQHEPLPEGKHHAVARMSRQWIAGLCALGSLGYVLLTVGRTEEHTAQLNEDVTRCWQETYQQIRAQVLLNAQNDGVSRKQQALQREYDEDTSDWLKKLVNPPGDMATQPTNSPERQQYGIDVSLVYQGQLDDLGRKFDGLVAQRKALDKERAQHPLPEARCGKS
jgi:hypothetical protein